MKVKILVACVVPGEDVKAGDVVDVPEPIAQRLVRMQLSSSSSAH